MIAINVTLASSEENDQVNKIYNKTLKRAFHGLCYGSIFIGFLVWGLMLKASIKNNGYVASGSSVLIP